MKLSVLAACGPRPTGCHVAHSGLVAHDIRATTRDTAMDDDRRLLLTAHLEQLRAKLSTELRSAIKSVRGLACGVSGSQDGDFQQDSTAADTEVAMAEIAAQSAQGLEDALRRLRNGTYGRCGDCGCDIELRRLEVLPFALRCRSCQESLEAASNSSPTGTYRRVDWPGLTIDV
jgi:DnaK suppressor protein